MAFTYPADNPVFEHNQLVGIADSQVQVMDCHHRQQTVFFDGIFYHVQSFQLVTQVKVISRLIQQQNFRFLAKSPRHHHPLAFAAAQFVKIAQSQRQNLHTPKAGFNYIFVLLANFPFEAGFTPH
ncbi:MAG: hypothetical protein EGMGGAKC_01045 [Dehalococcoides mccartyi]|nr:hypothetical protein [Dehalococcoides mccartyi]